MEGGSPMVSRDRLTKRTYRTEKTMKDGPPRIWLRPQDEDAWKIAAGRDPDLRPRLNGSHTVQVDHSVSFWWVQSSRGSVQYLVTVERSQQGITTSCICPAGWSGTPCKHVARVLVEMKILEDPEMDRLRQEHLKELEARGVQLLLGNRRKGKGTE
jgi:hypothetical protein